MVYFIYGSDDFIIQQHIKTILKKHNLNKKNMLNIDCFEDNISKAIDAVLTVSLLVSQNIVIAHNAFFLLTTKLTEKQKINHNLEELITFVNKTDDNILILIAGAGKLNKKLTVINKLMEKKTIIECKQLTSNAKRQMVEKAFANRNIIIDETTLEHFLSLTTNNSRSIISEVNKLSLLKMPLTKKNISDIVSYWPENNIFQLINMIFDKKQKAVLTIYHDLLKVGYSPLVILTILGTHMAFLSNILILNNQGLNNGEIALKLKKHIFAIKKNIFIAQKIGHYKIALLLDELLDIEFKIKIGKEKPDIIVEWFIIKLLR